ncbi:hypothetical protein Y032_0491g2405 [Ancylostoma ceylanicum]|uniref:Uncharacterized protein n=1 Tax=Ancylostoma ceylanicum TaxID=53326 RepID=A0A016WV49_9BILA|nr:hypothetical protein Y032_0491g2405 [Ancylostoma ceylanicum]
MPVIKLSGAYHREGKRGVARRDWLLGPPVTPICLNWNGVNPMAQGLFVLSAVRVKHVGVTSGPNVPIRVA